MAKKSPKEKKPKVTRTYNKFDCHWTPGSKNYTAQQFRYRLRYQKKDGTKKYTDWMNVNGKKGKTKLSGSAKSHTITIDFNEFFNDHPAADKILLFQYAVRGKEKKKKYCSWKKGKLASTSIKSKMPPIVTLEKDTESSYVTKVTIKARHNSAWLSKKLWYRYVEVQTALYPEGEDPVWVPVTGSNDSALLYNVADDSSQFHPEIIYKPITGANDEWNIKRRVGGIVYDGVSESSSVIENYISKGTSVHRDFRARMVGANGNTKWETASESDKGDRVFGASLKAENVKGIMTDNGGGVRVYVEFDYKRTPGLPIEYFIIKYCYATPNSSGSADYVYSQLKTTDTFSETETYYKYADNTYSVDEEVTAENFQNKVSNGLYSRSQAERNDSGSDGRKVYPSNDDEAFDNDMYHTGGRFDIETAAPKDQLLYVRVDVYYDNSVAYGKWVKAKLSDGTSEQSTEGILTPPTLTSVTQGVDEDVNTITIDATNNCSIDDSFLVVCYIRVATVSEKNLLNSNEITYIGVIEETGQVEEIFDIPFDWSESSWGIGIFAATGEVGEPEEIVSEDETESYEVYTEGINLTIDMRSEMVIQGGQVPNSPKNWSVENLTNPNEQEGSVKVSWNWNDWRQVTRCDISWTDDERNWRSNTGFEDVSVHSYEGNWRIINKLELGKTYYFRIRFVRELSTGSGETASAWTASKEVGLRSTPNIPTIAASPMTLVTTLETRCKSTLSWVYQTTDGKEQQSVEIRYADVIDGDLNNFTVDESIEPIANPGTERTPFTDQSYTLNAMELGWEPGETYYITIKLTSRSGMTTDEWATPVPIYCAESISCEIDREDEDYPFIDSEDNEVIYPILEELPFQIKVNGASENAWTELVIERNGEFDEELPDGTSVGGYDGEIVFTYRQRGDDKIELTRQMLTGRLDDDGEFTLRARVYDDYGQEAIDEQPFYVRWAHQAVMPVATITSDQEELISYIYIDTPEGYAVGDYIEIYRISTDKIELIASGDDLPDGSGGFGVTFVDPYPTLGPHGGHRIVYRTANGDYNTEEGLDAWVDFGCPIYDEEEIYEVGDTVIGPGNKKPYVCITAIEEPEIWTSEHWRLCGNECDYVTSIDNIIDYEDDRVYLRYNVDLSTQWKKDFKETKYLGGAIQGDWNAAVSRTSSMSTVVVTEDSETIKQIRELAMYAGACHVRTTDGSNYTADVQVSESRNYSPGLTTAYNLSFTRVDAEGLEGMLLSEWDDINDEGDESEDEEDNG